MSDFDHSLAIIIGINQYQNGISKLQTAVSDALALAELLGQNHGYEINLLLDADASFEGLEKLLHKILPQTIRESDRLLFYFAGHGIALNGEDGPEGYLIPQDASLGAVGTYLPMTTIQDALNELPCRHFLGIFDCCFAGAFRWASTRDIGAVPETIYRERYDRFLQDPAWQVITSAAYDQRALDAFSLEPTRGEVGNQSPFAAALLEALGGRADLYPPPQNGEPGGDGVITATELYLYLRDRVETATERRQQRQTPGLWPLQRHDKGEYIFLTPGHVLNLPPAPPLNAALNPYRGLASYDEVHRDLFFGREALTDHLVDFVRDRPLTIVLGASGTGKSSLVKAGLLPRLSNTAASEWCIVPPFRPGDHPLQALQLALDSFGKTSANDLPPEAGMVAEEGLALFFTHWQQGHSNTKLLLTVDQFEELVTAGRDRTESDRFLCQLATAITTHADWLRVVIILRSDFEPQFQSGPLHPWWQTGRFIVPAMARGELREAIEKPAALRVMYFEPHALVERLIDEVAQMPGALPLLSFALSELYLRYLKNVQQGLTDNRAITQADYEALGGVARSLTQRADAEYEALVREDPAYGRVVRDVLLRMVAVGGGEIARRRVLLSELDYPGQAGKLAGNVIQRLSAARLLVEGQDANGQPYVEPAHDALMRGWQRLLDWQREWAETLILQRRLTPAAREWQQQRQPKYLWNADPRLDLLQQTLESGDRWFNCGELAFVEQSVGRKRRNVRWRWGIAGGVMAGLSALTLVALISQRLSLISQVRASKQTAAVSLLSAPTALDGILEGLRADKPLQNPLLQLVPPDADLAEDVRGTLLSATLNVKERNRQFGHQGTVRNEWRPDGKQMVTAGEDGRITLRAFDGTLQKAWTADPVRLYRASFDPAGRFVATVGEKGYQLWTSAGQLVTRLDSRGGYPRSLDFSADGRSIVTGDGDGTIAVRTAQGKVLHTWTAHQGMVKSVRFSPDGRTIVSAGQDGFVRLWSPSGRKISDCQEHAWGAEFSPDGRKIATAGDNGTFSLWSVAGKRLGNWRADDRRLWAIAFSPDGRMVATAGEDGRAKVWSLVGQKIWEFQGHAGPVRTVDFTPDGRYLLTGGDDGTSRIWVIGNPPGAIDLVAHRGAGTAIAFSPDGSRLVSADQDGTAMLQLLSSVGKGDRLNMSGNRSGLQDIAFSADGRRLAAAAADGAIRIWSSQGKLLQTLKGHTGAVEAVAWIGDRPQLISGGADGTVRLWTLKEEGDRGASSKIIRRGSSIHTVSASADSQLLASAGDDSAVSLWGANGQLLHTFQGHIGAVRDLTFSRDGQSLASAGQDGTIRLWQVKDRLIGPLFQVYGREARSVAFSPEGTQVLSGDSEGGVQLWNVVRRQQFAGWQALQGAVTGVAYSPDGTHVATIGVDGVVRLWPLDSRSTLIDRSCRELHDFLSLRAQTEPGDRDLCSR